MQIPNFQTLDEAKAYLRENWEVGTPCPCCGQHVKLYKRSLTSGQAQALIILYRYMVQNPDEEYVHVSTFNTTAFRGGDFAKLRYWRLIEASENVDTDKKDSGLWRITERGVEFVTGERYIPKRVHLYNGKIVGWSEDNIDIVDALGTKFSYEELMKG